MAIEKKDKRGGTGPDEGEKSCGIVYIKAGDLCPNCGFANLRREPGNIIKCPVCGWGSSDRCT